MVVIAGSSQDRLTQVHEGKLCWRDFCLLLNKDAGKLRMSMKRYPDNFLKENN